MSEFVDRRVSDFVNRLEVLGFFKYTLPEAVTSLKRDFQETRWAAIFGDSGRQFNADAETLTEGGVGDFLRLIEPFLKKQRISLDQVEDVADDSGQSYFVMVNGRCYKIYDADEVHRSENQLGLMWGLSGARAFAIVNGLLDGAGSDERLYAVNGGNDLFGFFLTPELREVVCSYSGVKPRDKPYLHTEEYPWFGEEHA